MADEQVTSKISIRPLTPDDARPLSAAFAAMGWDKPVDAFLRYLHEQEQGQRRAWVAEWNSDLAGYITLWWEPHDPVFRARSIPEVFKRLRVSS